MYKGYDLKALASVCIMQAIICYSFSFAWYYFYGMIVWPLCALYWGILFTEFVIEINGKLSAKAVGASLFAAIFLTLWLPAMMELLGIPIP
jgi:hypothetical protein